MLKTKFYTSVDDYRTLIKYLNQIKIKYYTDQLLLDRNLSVIIRNFLTTIPEKYIFSTLINLNFIVVFIIRVQNKHMSLIPIVFVFLDKTAKKLCFVNHLLNHIVFVKNRKSNLNIPENQNCQRFQNKIKKL